VGGALQKILQGRGSKTGHGFTVKRALLPALVFLCYTGLIFNLPSKRPLVWFPFTFLVGTVYAYRCFVRREKAYTVETLSSAALILSGGIQLLHFTWLHSLYTLYLVMLSLFYGPGIIVPLSLMLPLLDIQHFMQGNPWEEAFFLVVTILCSVVVSMVFSGIKKERDRAKKTLLTLKEEAEDMDFSFPVDIKGSESFVSRHLSSANKANEEIQEMLLIARHVVSADSAAVYMLKGNSLHLRCSSDPSPGISIPDGGTLEACIKQRQPVTLSLTSHKSGTPCSLIAAPVMDGHFVAGVLTVSASRPGAFQDAEAKTVEIFSHQVMRILKRQRIYSQVQKEHIMLKKLKDGGTKLITSLKIHDIAQSLMDAVYRIAPQERVSMALFVPREDGFELIRQVGFALDEEGLFDFRNHRIGVVCRSREPEYISNLSNERNPVFPFSVPGEGTAFMLPLVFEKELHGVLVYVSPKINAIRPYEIELLKVLGNQASSSLANAKLHAEIENMAVTDGLTGLFNHRTFQERLSDEFKRLQRFSNPLSLLLIDIDFFKKVNDTYGHPSGDRILKGVAGIIKETIRTSDVSARYGGEEFAAMLLGTNQDGALKMAERLRKAVQDTRFTVDGKEITVTVSIGVATSPYDAGVKEELIEKADKALYGAKRNGRNRCVLWSEIKEG
jgi:diguanylate cyclase (GGDEF)-like protein